MKHVLHTLSSLVTMTLFLGSSASLIAQCDEGQSQVVVEILTDNYPGEITWTLSDSNGQLLSGGPYNLLERPTRTACALPVQTSFRACSL